MPELRLLTLLSVINLLVGILDVTVMLLEQVINLCVVARTRHASVVDLRRKLVLQFLQRLVLLRDDRLTTRLTDL